MDEGSERTAALGLRQCCSVWALGQRGCGAPTTRRGVLPPPKGSPSDVPSPYNEGATVGGAYSMMPTM